MNITHARKIYSVYSYTKEFKPLNLHLLMQYILYFMPQAECNVW